VSDELLLVITPLRMALERIQRKAEPLLAKATLLETEDGQDLLDVICMQFLAAGEALKRLEKLQPGLLAESFPEIDWKGAMGFRDVIAHQYFYLDAEQVKDASHDQNQSQACGSLGLHSKGCLPASTLAGGAPGLKRVKSTKAAQGGETEAIDSKQWGMA